MSKYSTLAERVLWNRNYRRSPKGRWVEMLAGAKKRAKALGVAFDLDRAWLMAKLDAGACEATGLAFEYGVWETCRQGWTTNPWSPSLDRKDPKGGYTKDNVQVVVWIYNLAKNRWSPADVLRMARALAERTMP